MTDAERIAGLEQRLAAAEARIAKLEAPVNWFLDPCAGCGPTCDSTACPKRIYSTYTFPTTDGHA